MPEVLISPSITIPPVKPEVRILTQNCCLLPSFIFQSKGDDNRKQRAQLIKQMIQRYDIVLLQEVFSTKWCNKWCETFADVPGMQSVRSVRAIGKMINSGLIILSRYPVLVGSFVPFRSKSISNSLIDRGFLYAQIKIGEKIVHTITTHLNPSESHYGILSPEEYRRRQLAEILEFKKSVGHDHDTWVIGGDFNDCSTVRSLEPMMSVSLDQSPCATSHDRVPYAINCEGVHECIDYITTNRPQRYSRILQNLISDHYGVEVAVAL